MQQQGVQAAKFGAKLNYFKQLKGVCPEGYEMKMFRTGGKVCKKCMKKQDGGEVAEAKCGGSIKERLQKASCGKKLDKAACGKKMKKKAEGGEVEMDKCGKKLKKSCGGSKMPFKANGGSFIPFPRKGLN